MAVEESKIENRKSKTPPPRLGFLGVGWIGRNRMEAIIESGVAEVVAVADLSPELVEQAGALAPDAEPCDSLEGLLEVGLDGVVIATPSALHAAQSVAALERGVAVFCQKPLARTAEEAHEVVAAAEAADRLLGVDLSYRYTAGMQQIHALIAAGELGKVYAAELVFHNAYGPDKPWFYDPALSGGGCVMDLGIHLVDLALWALGFPEVEAATSRLFAHGHALRDRAAEVEDYAVARLDLAGGVVVGLTCSWNLPAGQDAGISATFYGPAGGATLHNVGGSFYDFQAERFRGRARETLATPPDAWGGRAAVAWAQQLAAGTRFDPEAWHLVAGAAAVDAIYAGAEPLGWKRHKPKDGGWSARRKQKRDIK